MSAFMVSDMHIQVLVGAGLEFSNNKLQYFTRPTSEGGTTTKDWIKFVEEHQRELTLETANKVGQMLKNANAASLVQRYEGRSDGMYEHIPFRFKASYINGLDPIKMLGAIACFNYQASEVKNHELTEYFGFLKALEKKCLEKIQLDHENVPWSVDELDDVRKTEFIGREIRTLSQLIEKTLDVG